MLLRDVLAHIDLHVLLHVGDAIEVEDALHHLLRVFHLLDGLLAAVLRQALVVPVLAHHRVDEVLVDAGQLGAQHVVQDLDDLVVPLHDTSASDL
jgi:hypothetical protein